MASNKHIDKICLVAALLALVLALVLLNATDRTDGGKTMGYESRLFDSRSEERRVGKECSPTGR